MNPEYLGPLAKYVIAQHDRTGLPLELCGMIVESMASTATFIGLDIANRKGPLPAGVSTVVVLPSTTGKSGLVDDLSSFHRVRDKEIDKKTDYGTPSKRKHHNFTMTMANTTTQKIARRYSWRDSVAIVTSEGGQFFNNPSWSTNERAGSHSAHNLWMMDEEAIVSRVRDDFETRGQGRMVWCVATQPLKCEPMTHIDAQDGISSRVFSAIRNRSQLPRNTNFIDEELEEKLISADKVVEDFDVRAHRIRVGSEGKVWAGEKRPKQVLLISTEWNNYLAQHTDPIQNEWEDNPFLLGIRGRAHEHCLRSIAVQVGWEHMSSWNKNLDDWADKQPKKEEAPNDFIHGGAPPIDYPPEMLAHDINDYYTKDEIKALIDRVVKWIEVKIKENKNFHDNIIVDQDEEIANELRKRMGTRQWTMREIQQKFKNSYRTAKRIHDIILEAERTRQVEGGLIGASGTWGYKWLDNNEHEEFDSSVR